MTVHTQHGTITTLRTDTGDTERSRDYKQSTRAGTTGREEQDNSHFKKSINWHQARPGTPPTTTPPKKQGPASGTQTHSAALFFVLPKPRRLSSIQSVPAHNTSPGNPQHAPLPLAPPNRDTNSTTSRETTSTATGDGGGDQIRNTNRGSTY